MAGDWMKIELELPDKPEVHYIAGALCLDPDAVVGKLMRVWAWFDKHTVNGNALGVTYSLIDRITGATGFGEAMAFAGWLEQRDKTLVMPAFDKHTSKSAKERALTAKRVAKTRNADVTPTPLPREEKRREEEKQKKDAPVGAANDDELFDGVDPQVVADFKALRKAKKAAITATAVAGIKREAEKAGLTLESALRICCEKGWAGFSASWQGIPTATPAAKRRELL